MFRQNEHSDQNIPHFPTFCSNITQQSQQWAQRESSISTQAKKILLVSVNTLHLLGFSNIQAHFAMT